jgi:hypothetical protein
MCNSCSKYTRSFFTRLRAARPLVRHALRERDRVCSGLERRDDVVQEHVAPARPSVVHSGNYRQTRARTG